MCIRVRHIFFRLQGIKVYFGTLSLKFQKARTKIEVVLGLPCWLSQLNWDSHQGRLRTTSILVRAFWNFKLKVLKYPRNCNLQYTLIPNFWLPLIYIFMYNNVDMYNNIYISWWVYFVLHQPLTAALAKLLSLLSSKSSWFARSVLIYQCNIDYYYSLTIDTYDFLMETFDGIAPSKMLFPFSWNPYLKTDFASLLVFFFIKNWRKNSIKSFLQKYNNSKRLKSESVIFIEIVSLSMNYA